MGKTKKQEPVFARKLRGIELNDLDDEEYEFLKFRGENWKDQWHQPCRAKSPNGITKVFAKCKEYISSYRKSLQKWLREIVQHQHEQWGQQSWHKLHQQAHGRKPRNAQAALVSTARRARSLRLSWCSNIHTSWLKFIESSSHPHVIHVRFSLTSPSSLSTSNCLSPSSSTPPSWCTPSSTLSSTTWSPCKTCAPPRKRE